MKVLIGFQDEPLATGTLQPDGKILWEGDRSVAFVVKNYTKPGMTGEEILRNLLARLQGRWWCVEVPEGEEPAFSERWPGGDPQKRGGEFKPREGDGGADVPTVYPPGSDAAVPNASPSQWGNLVSQKSEESSPGTLRPGVRQRLDQWLGSAKLPPERHALYRSAMVRVLSSLSNRATNEVIHGTSPPGGGVTFKASQPEVALLGRKIGLKVPREQEWRVEAIAKSSEDHPGKTWLIFDGPARTRTAETLPHTYAHEVAHLLDYGNSRSSQPDWRDAYASEINLPHYPVSQWATSAPHEGWAEFGRLAMLSPDVARRDFPKCWAVWQKHGLV